MSDDREALLGFAGECKTASVSVRGRDFNVRGMTVFEFEVNQDRAKKGQSTASLLARCIVTDTGMRLFKDEDVERLSELPLDVASPLLEKITELSGLTEGLDADTAKAKAIEDAEGNSAPTRGDGSSSE